jgi:hypothetical protein
MGQRRSSNKDCGRIMAKLYPNLEHVLWLHRQPSQEYNARRQAEGRSACEFKEDKL